jgi:hypothetical protein
MNAVEGSLRWARWAHRRLRPIRPRVLNRGAVDDDAALVGALPAAACLRRLSLEVKAEALTPGRGFDYRRVGRSEPYRRMCAAAVAVRGLDPSALLDSERLAFWVNVYNALVIQASVEFDLRRRLDELGGLDAFFARAAYEIDGQTFSLDDMEHGILRANRGHGRSRGSQFAASDPRAALCLAEIDPRLHFVLHCGAASCPAVGVLEVASLEQQLDDATLGFLEGPDGFAVDAGEGRVVLPAFMRWNAGDFGGEAGLLPFVGRYVELPDVEGWRLDYREYDWRLG